MWPPTAAAALVALAALPMVTTAQPNDGLELVVLPPAYAARFGAACLDGTPPGFYLRSAATPASATKWRLHFRGGGWCFTAEDCASRTATDLGSSAHFVPFGSTPNIAGGFMNDSSAAGLWSDWNLVFFQYCDGTSWTGANTQPVVAGGGTTLYFRGSANLEAVFSYLDDGWGLLSNATDVVVSGTSAGGLATYLHADRIAAMFAPSARVVAMPDSGFFLDWPSFISGQPAYRTAFQGAIGPALWNASSGTHQGCVAATPPSDVWQCFFAAHVYLHTATPFFITNSAADAWQVANILDLPCSPGSCNTTEMAAFDAFQAALQQAIMAAHATHADRDALYLGSCFQHGQTCADGDWGWADIRGETQAALLAGWSNGSVGGSAATWVDALWPGGGPCADVAHGWC